MTIFGRRLVACTGLAASVMGSLAAQTPPAGPQVAASITAADIARHLSGLAAESLRGRVTPSPALERTAQYVAAEFQRLGLTAAGASRFSNKDKIEVWRYPMPGQLVLDDAHSWVRLELALTAAGRPIYPETDGDAAKQRVVAPSAMTKRVVVPFASAAYFAPEVGPPTVAQAGVSSFAAAFNGHVSRAGSRHTVVLAGCYTVATLPLAAVHEAVVLYLPCADADAATRQQILIRLYDASAGVVVASDADSAAFAAAQEQVRARPVPVVDRSMREVTGPRRWPWAAVVRAETVRDLVAAAGLDLAQLRADPTPVVRALPETSVWLGVKADSTGPRQTAPTVLGLLEGTDSALKQQYIVIMAHMDAGGADDNASGTAGLLALAQAFSQPGARPRRSLLFFATSGGAEGKNAWGSNAYLDPLDGDAPGNLVGVLNLDRIGRLAGGDTLLIDGLQDVDLVQRPEWVAAAHPELGLVVADGGPAARPTSDHFPFVRHGLPSWFLHAGTHAAPRADTLADTLAGSVAVVGDHVEETARLLQFVFYLSETIANAEKQPRWSTEGQRHLNALAPAPAP